MVYVSLHVWAHQRMVVPVEHVNDVWCFAYAVAVCVCTCVVAPVVPFNAVGPDANCASYVGMRIELILRVADETVVENCAAIIIVDYFQSVPYAIDNRVARYRDVSSTHRHRDPFVIILNHVVRHSRVVAVDLHSQRAVSQNVVADQAVAVAESGLYLYACSIVGPRLFAAVLNREFTDFYAVSGH